MAEMIVIGLLLVVTVMFAVWIIGAAPYTFDEDEPEEDQ